MTMPSMHHGPGAAAPGFDDLQQAAEWFAVLQAAHSFLPGQYLLNKRDEFLLLQSRQQQFSRRAQHLKVSSPSF